MIYTIIYEWLSSFNFYVSHGCFLKVMFQKKGDFSLLFACKLVFRVHY
jgi:hypothetical protein